jgi:hypothetical protein
MVHVTQGLEKGVLQSMTSRLKSCDIKRFAGLVILALISPIASAETIRLTCTGILETTKDIVTTKEPSAVDISVDAETGKATVHNFQCFTLLAHSEKCIEIDMKVSNEKFSFAEEAKSKDVSAFTSLELDRFAGVLNVSQRALNNFPPPHKWEVIMQAGRLRCEQNARRF